MRGRWAIAIAYAVTLVYTGTFFVVAGRWCPEPWRARWLTPRSSFAQRIKQTLLDAGWEEPSRQLVQGTYFVLTAALIPLVVMAFVRMAGRRYRRHLSDDLESRPDDGGLIWGRLLTEIGLRWPSRLGVRVIVVSLVVVAPFLWWMVRQNDFPKQFHGWMQSVGFARFALYYLVVLFVEHLFFHGVVIAATSPTGRWPDDRPVAAVGGHGWRRGLAWLGLGCPTGEARGTHRVMRWLGLPDGYLMPVIWAGLLFGAAHLGKNPRELLLSFPGGVLCGYIALRCNSWLVPLIIHVGVGAIASMMVPAV